MTDKPTEYTIRSLRDIFELPTEDMVERCLREIAQMMLVMRNTAPILNDMDMSLAKPDERESMPLRWLWPDDFVWRDDNGGTSDLHQTVGNKEILVVKIQHKKHRKKKE